MAVIVYGVFYFADSVSLLMLLFILHILMEKQGDLKAKRVEGDDRSADDLSISINDQTEADEEDGVPFTLEAGSFVQALR